MEKMAEELLKLFLPSEIDWNRYKLEKVVELKDENISSFVWRLLKWHNFFFKKHQILAWQS